MSCKLTIKEVKGNYLEFQLENVSRHFANALRRAMIAEVPTLAIDNLRVYQNTSPLPDEYIAHRLGLIPFDSSAEKHFCFYDQCSCAGGCEKCTVLFKIDVKCTEDVPILVTADDLVRLPCEDMDMASHHDNVHPAFIPTENNATAPVVIAKLSKGQSLQLVVEVKKSIGRVHAKWAPVCISAYHQIADIKFDPHKMRDIGNDQKAEIVDSCPCGVLSLNHSNGEIEIENIEKCSFCNSCVRVMDQMRIKHAISIESRPNIFVFNIETIGMHPPEKVVKYAFEALSNKLDTFMKNVKEAKEKEIIAK